MATVEQLMSQYGVAWLSFDAVGSITDKLRTTYGAVSGITRVEGYNGEGNAFYFNGSSSFANMTTNVIPVGEKSIRFKIKSIANNTEGVILGNMSGYGQKGLRLYLTTDRKLCAYFTTGGGNASTTYSLVVENKEILSDDKWHEVLFTVDNQKVSRFYIDGKLEAIGVITVIEYAGSAPLQIGRRYSSNDLYFKGYLDEIEFYNKTLTPKDFENKKLAFKAEDNKYLVLSKEGNRVKHISDASESTLVKYGESINDIDYATDRYTPFNLKRKATEYEVINDTNTALSTGKIFTAPISVGFKTANIENND